MNNRGPASTGPPPNSSSGSVADPEADGLSWLERWLTALLDNRTMEEDELRIAVALVVLALRRNALTGVGFDLEADNDELAAIAGLSS